MFCAPPSRHLFSWSASSVLQNSFQNEIVGRRRVYYGNSWILLLGLLFRQLKKEHSGKSIIILPGYCCNEFVKAILLANCEPVFVEVDACGVIDVDALELAITANGESVLGVMLANNTGKNANVKAVKKLCLLNDILLIEDAGYSLGGTDLEMNKFGTIGDVVIINMSEGKLLPVGGGVLLVEDHVNLRFGLDEIMASSWVDAGKDIFSYLIYFLGSQNLVFSIHRYLKSILGLDLKRLLSNEVLRRNENYVQGDIHGNIGHLELDATFIQNIAHKRLKTISRVKQYLIQKNYANIPRIKDRRWKLYCFYRDALGHKFSMMQYHHHEVVVKIPILLIGLNEDEIEKLACFGVTKQYSHEWAYHSPIEFPQSSKFFQWQYCLPVHEGVSWRRAEKLVNYLLLKSN